MPKERLLEQCVEYVDSSPDMREFQSRLFSRIVPTIKNIGLWGPKIRRAYSNMGVMAYADLDSEQLMENDESSSGVRCPNGLRCLRHLRSQPSGGRPTHRLLIQLAEANTEPSRNREVHYHRRPS
ncbi:MAG: hypothetical protein WBQ86_18855 [Candidatus Binatus sp.]